MTYQLKFVQGSKLQAFGYFLAWENAYLKSDVSWYIQPEYKNVCYIFFTEFVWSWFCVFKVFKHAY